VHRSSRIKLVAGRILAAIALASVIGGVLAQQLTFWTFLDPASDDPRSAVQSELVAQFEAEHPGVTVNVEVIPFADIGSRMIQAVAVGRGPDVFRITAPRMFAEQFEAGTIHPLDEFVADWTEEERNDFLLPWEMGMYQGQKMALPIEHRAVMMWYRADLFEEAGIDVPATWDEAIAAAQQLATGGLVGYPVGLSTAGAGNGFLEWFRPVIWAAGGDYLDEEGNAIFDSPEGVRAYQLLYDMVHEHQVMPSEALNWSVDDMYQGFRAGRVVMVNWGTHRVAGGREALGQALQVAPIPSFEPDTPTPTEVSGWHLAISATTNQPELAYAFIEHMTSTEAQIMNAREAGELPARVSAYDDPWFHETEAGQEMLEWRDTLLAAGRLARIPADYPRLHDLLLNAAQEIVLNNAPIESTLARAAAEYNSGRR
jgi:multiple sugar transport system substrate-binding protein